MIYSKNCSGKMIGVMATFPVRCFGCGKPIGDKWDTYREKLKVMEVDEALDDMKIIRYCCRIHFISHVPELEEVMLMYPPSSKMKGGKIES